jgi:hypothetical protein
MGLPPPTLNKLLAAIALRVYLFVILDSVMRLRQQFRGRACLSPILIRWPCDLLPWSLNVTVIPQTHVGLFWCKCNHRQWIGTPTGTNHAWLNCLRLRMDSKMPRAIAVNNVTVVT